MTFPFSWRRRLAQDGALLGALGRIFVETVLAFYAQRAWLPGAKTGAVTVVQTHVERLACQSAFAGGLSRRCLPGGW
jgi:hypothetical protein